jgi:Flp pilus assembly protein TadB
VPLSEHEQRLLEQIEQALYADDPKFASIYQGTDVRTHYRRRVVRAAIGLVVGIAVLLAGVVIPLVPLGVAGFVIMLIAVSFGVASWQRMTGHRVSGPREGAPPRGPKARGPRRSVVQRLEDRWQRRQEER